MEVKIDSVWALNCNDEPSNRTGFYRILYVLSGMDLYSVHQPMKYSNRGTLTLPLILVERSFLGTDRDLFDDMVASGKCKQIFAEHIKATRFYDERFSHRKCITLWTRLNDVYPILYI
jgi:hypothetical protein